MDKAHLIVENSILINAPASKVWDALTNPEQTKKYMFGCETVSDWKIGSPLLWTGNHEGKDMVFVKGIITDIQPDRFLSYTTIDPNSGVEDKPENYLTVTYDLKGTEQETILTVTQGDYSEVGDGDRRFKKAIEAGGWQPILNEIKKIVEGTSS